MLTARRSMYAVRLGKASIYKLDISGDRSRVVTATRAIAVFKIDDERLDYALEKFEETVGKKHKPSARAVISVFAYLATRTYQHKDGETYADESRDQIRDSTRLRMGTITDVLAFATWCGVSETLRGGHRGQNTRRRINPDLMPAIPKGHIPTLKKMDRVGISVGIRESQKLDGVDKGSQEDLSRHSKSLTKTTKSDSDVAALDGATSELIVEHLDPVALSESMNRATQIAMRNNKGEQCTQHQTTL